MSDDCDSPWKEILEYFFPQFMAFFFPVVYADINWSMGFVTLDKELQQIVRDATTGVVPLHRLDIGTANGIGAVLYRRVDPIRGETAYALCNQC
ncbi:hypothetical protein CCP3SC15_5930002 [Gammaproteobacteria bacterium]